MGVKDHCGMVFLDLRSIFGRIYVGDHYTLLHTKHISCGPLGFERKILRVFFFIIKLSKGVKL